LRRGDQSHRGQLLRRRGRAVRLHPPDLEQKADEADKNRELQQKEAKQLAARSQREADNREKELQLRKRELDLAIYKERKEVYYALCDAASDIAASRDRKEVTERARAFLKLFNVRAHILACDELDVSSQKVWFLLKLKQYLEGEDKESTVSPFDYFGQAALDLTGACRKHLDLREIANPSP
jgi:hypothetical protein